MIRLPSITLGLAAGLLACGGPPVPSAPQTVAPAAAREARGAESPRDLLSSLVDRYWDESGGLSPWYSWGGAERRFGETPSGLIAAQSLADSLAMERRYLAALLAISRGGLDAESKLTYDIFRRDRELAIEGFTFPSELLPVNAYDSVPQRFAQMATAAEPFAWTGERDFDNWRVRALSFERWTNQAIMNLREGLRRGYTVPLAAVERTLPLLAALGEDSPGNAFYWPLNGGEGASTSDRARWSASIATVVKGRVLPAYRLLHDFLQREYLPRARVTVGLSSLPLGASWYGFLVKRATDGTQTPADLHALGLAEVSRLHGRIQTLLSETSFAGNPQGFLDDMRRDPRFSYRSPQELLAAYQELKTQVAAAAPSSFPIAPRADVEIRAVEPFRQATTPALSYRPAMASGRVPAVLYVNTAGLDARPAIAVSSRFLREALPGHHLQLALQRERTDLPRFRRFGGAPALIEGWGLYAASLGDEMGVYRDPQAKFGALLAQLECAAGLVVDTGIHAQQWTRGQALDYLHAQTPLDEVAATSLVDRDIALPGEALACTVGYLKIQSWRAQAQQRMGSRFDVRAFHAEMLRNGAAPLDLLDATLKRWMDAPAGSE